MVTPRDFAHDIIAGEGVANSTLMRWVKGWTTVANQRLGVLLEMDLAPQHEIPLGLTLGHTQGFSTSDPNAGPSGSLFGIWFTARAALRLGTELGFITVPDRNLDTKTNVIFGNFSVRYYF